MRKVCVVITARPSYARIKTVLEALREREDVELQVIAAASAIVTRFGRVVDLIREDGFRVHAEIPCVVDDDATQGMVLSTGLLTTQLATVLDQLQPDVVVTIADRHETLATAIAASYQNIPLCHVQGGEVSGSIDDKVRNAITQLADIHCVATEKAGERVRAMRPGAEVHVTGCPSIDIAAEALRLGPLPGHDVVVLQHPVSTEVDQAAEQMRETIKALEGMDVLWFWPGEEPGNAAMAKEMRLAGLHPVRNMAPLEFLRTLLGSRCLVGNSSVGIRECSFLGVPFVSLGLRQQDREHGNNVFWIPSQSEMSKAIAFAVRRARHTLPAIISTSPDPDPLYGDGHAGERIAGILAGRPLEAVA